MTFFESSFLWRDAVIASSVLAAALAVTGVYTVTRRIVFLPAALSQMSGFAVVLAFVFVAAFPSVEHKWFGSPTVVSLGLTLIGALVLGWMPEPKRLTKDVIIGGAYIIASALVIMISDRIPQEAQHIEDILFGNAVAVETTQMVIAVVTAVLVLIIHAIFKRVFILVSFDRPTAVAHGVPVSIVDALLFLTMGLAIAVATKTIGAMPVFAYGVLPAACALWTFSNINSVLLAAPIIGAVAAFLGYWASFSLGFPTGACTVVVIALFFVPAALVRVVMQKPVGKFTE